MRLFKDFESYNAYVGLSAPLDLHLDIGFYDAKKGDRRLQEQINAYRDLSMALAYE